MARFKGFEDDDKAPGGQAVIESNWEPMRNALAREDWFQVVDIYRGVPDGTKHALHARATHYLAKKLALAPTKQAPFEDEGGLNRLIYMVWPTLPIRVFDFEDLPTMMLEVERYNQMYREGGWLQGLAAQRQEGGE